MLRGISKPLVLAAAVVADHAQGRAPLARVPPLVARYGSVPTVAACHGADRVSTTSSFDRSAATW